MRYKNVIIIGLINDLDFEKIQACMLATDWTWKDDKTPTIEEMKDTASDLLNKVMSDKTIERSATGGFEAWRDKDNNFGIRFVISDSDTSLFDD